MAVLRIAIVGALIAWAAGAQTVGDEVRAKMAAVKYPQIAQTARIQGDVKITVSDGEATAALGPPMLLPTAIRAALAIAPLLDRAKVDVTFHFVIDAGGFHIERGAETVKRGNAVDRFFLRMFGRKTVKQVAYERCKEDEPPPNKVEVSARGVEIWLFGKAMCLQTSTTLIAWR